MKSRCAYHIMPDCFLWFCRLKTLHILYRRNFRTRKNFVLWRSRVFVRYKFSYLEAGVTYTGIRTRLSYATNFRTFSQKYEIYENLIKSRTKISAITVYIPWPDPRIKATLKVQNCASAAALNEKAFSFRYHNFVLFTECVAYKKS